VKFTGIERLRLCPFGVTAEKQLWETALLCSYSLRVEFSVTLIKNSATVSRRGCDTQNVAFRCHSRRDLLCIDSSPLRRAGM
jgi:hypothetical protein